jgi:glutathione S-transferase
MFRALDVTTSVLTSVTRLLAGFQVSHVGPRPELPLELYEFESCPFCRKVREAASVLDLELLVKPCPKRGQRFRPFVASAGGSEQFPYLVDPNTGKSLFESDDIVRYLFANYGDGPVPALLNPMVSTPSSILAGVWRLSSGTFARASTLPAQPLELYSFEASPYCRIVREALCVLELPYRLHNVAKGSDGRAALKARAGKAMVPCLVDPNTGVEMFESADIVAYLERTYAVQG